ncbi:PAS domain S-box protein [Prolixibacteraceae bacterium JC049]|nr:PAS domain S-box protein [Prolixibacteraceae bacterium JC049]
MLQREIKILIIEDNQLDVVILIDHIKRKIPSFNYVICDNEKDFRHHLNTSDFDIIISDYRIPGFGGEQALKIVVDNHIDIPFIISSGTIGEEAVVKMIHKGATDYLMKDRLDRVGVAIKNAIEKHEIERENKKALEQLKESEERFRSLAEASPIGIILIEGNNVSFINKKAKEIGPSCLGKLLSANNYLSSTQSCQNKNFCNCLFDDVSNLSLNKGEASTFYDQENNRWLEYIISRNASNIQILFRDVTNEVLDNLEIQKLSQALEVSPAAISITSTKGIIEYVNEMFTEITGYTKEEVIGKKHSMLKSGRQSPETYKELWGTILQGEIWNGELLNRKKDGALYWTSYTISGIKNEKGDLTHFIGISTDITKAKEIQEQLIVAKEKAEESDHLKSSFLANMSHEIRTPLNAIMGFSSLLPNVLDNEENIKLYVDQIERNGDKLLTLINDILDISKIESDTISLNLEQFSMNDLLKDLETDYSTILEQMNKDLQFSVQLLNQDVLIYSDRVRLYQIISNFVNNAFKYTDKGRVDVIVNILGKNRLRLEVKDTGMGISDDDLKNVFSQFFQVEDAHTRKFGGTGLGLAIVKKLSQLLNCKVGVKSKLGKGSTFKVEIPYFIY